MTQSVVGYREIKALPSRFVPYPDGTRIFTREFTYGEVYYISEIRQKIDEIIRFVKEKEIIKTDGTNLEELTLDDFEYLTLMITNSSFPEVYFNISAGECPKCKDKSPSELGLSDLPNELIKNQKPTLNKVLLPSDIVFNVLDDKVEMPIEVELDFLGKQEIDFVRLKHLLNAKEIPSVIDFDWTLENVYNFDRDKLTFSDLGLLSYAYRLLDHGIKNEFEINCPICQTKYQIKTEWEVGSFIPFREDRDIVENRITFGKRS